MQQQPAIHHSCTYKSQKYRDLYYTSIYQTIFRRHCRRTSEMKTFKRNGFFHPHSSFHFTLRSQKKRKSQYFLFRHTHANKWGLLLLLVRNGAEMLWIFLIFWRDGKDTYGLSDSRCPDAPPSMLPKNIPMLNYSFLSCTVYVCIVWRLFGGICSMWYMQEREVSVLSTLW